MARTYTLKKRAEQQADTRRRIAEAALELHGRVGPAQTTLSMVAEQAGVQRHTLYAHFPDERSLLMACSGLHLERDPFPGAEPLARIADPEKRLRIGLSRLYEWYARNSDVAGNVLRDAEFHPPTREIAALRFEPHVKAYETALQAGFEEPRSLAMIKLALSFHTWRTLARDCALGNDGAVEAMATAILCERC